MGLAMNRRQLLSLATVGIAALFSHVSLAMPYAFEEGVHYKTLPDNARALVSKGTVQEFFFYACPHCYHMEAPLHDWINTHPAGIRLEQIPAVFQSPAWSMLAHLHYALKASKQLDKMHIHAFEYFKRVQEKSVTAPKNKQDIADQLIKLESSFNKDTFLQAYDSDSVNEDVKRAQQLSGQYQLEAVPTFVINGKYLTDLPMAGNHQKLFALIEWLAKQ